MCRESEEALQEIMKIYRKEENIYANSELCKENGMSGIGSSDGCMLSYFRLSENLWDVYPNTFSGGERLRLNLAAAMVRKPRFMLLDEPIASLDNKTKILVKDMLKKLKEKKTSMLGIFHDLEFMDGVCDRVYNISEGSFQ